MLDEEAIYASYKDKLDWKYAIMRSLENANNCKNKYLFSDFVESCVKNIANTYPGWDAREDVNRVIQVLRKKYLILKELWYKKNNTKRWTQKYKFEFEVDYMFNKDILEYLNNYCGKRRMLLIGNPDTSGIDYTD